MESDWDILCIRGISDDVASQQESALVVCETKWRICSTWCSTQQVKPRPASESCLPYITGHWAGWVEWKLISPSYLKTTIDQFYCCLYSHTLVMNKQIKCHFSDYIEEISWWLWPRKTFNSQIPTRCIAEWTSNILGPFWAFCWPIYSLVKIIQIKKTH